MARSGEGAGTARGLLEGPHGVRASPVSLAEGAGEAPAWAAAVLSTASSLVMRLLGVWPCERFYGGLWRPEPTRGSVSCPFCNSWRSGGGRALEAPLGEGACSRFCCWELALALAPALVSPKRHLGLEESGGPQRAAPRGGVRGAEAGAAGQSRSQGLTPPSPHLGDRGTNKPGQKGPRGLLMETPGPATSTRAPLLHSEGWAGPDHSRPAGVSGWGRAGLRVTLSRSLSLQPFAYPVCTPEGVVFDLL